MMINGQQPAAVNPAYYYAPPSPTPPKGEPAGREFSKKDGAIALWALVLGFLFMRLFVMQVGIATCVFVWLFTAIAVWFMRTSGGMKTAASWGWMAVTTVCGFSFVWQSGSFFTYLLTMLCAVLLVATGTRNQRAFVSRHIGLDVLSTGIVRPFSRFGLEPVAAISHIRKNGKKQWLWCLLGVGIAVPLTLIIVSLLADADEGFDALLAEISRVIPDEIFGMSGENVVSFLFGFPIACYVFGLLFGNKERPEGMVVSDEAQQSMQRIPGALAHTVLIPVCLIYPLFFVSQLPQYFAAFRQILPDGFVYSSYARQGFFELCTVSVINLMLIAAAHFFMRSREAARVYQSILSLFTLLLLATAARKMVLYIEAYGLTVSRVLTCLFMAFLAVIFVALLLKQFITRIPVAAIGFVTAALLIIGWQFGPVDRTIAEYNISRYESGELGVGDNLDFLYDLSYSAAPATARLLDHPDPDVQLMAAQHLSAWYDEWQTSSPLDFTIEGAVAGDYLQELVDSGKLELTYEYE